MELSASDVQPRMTGEMRPMDSQGFGEYDKTVFAPQKAATLRPSPETANTTQTPAVKPEPKAEEKPAQAMPRLTMEGRPLPQQIPFGTDQPSWYIAYSKNKRGPMTMEQVGAHLRENAVQGDIYAWRAGFDNWKRLQDVPEFAEIVRMLDKMRALEGLAAQGIQPETKAEPAVSEGQRKTFTELLRTELGENGAVPGPSVGTQTKLDISQLLETSTVSRIGEKAQKKDGKEQVVLEEYVPKKKKKTHWGPIIIFGIVFLIVIATPLTLAHLQIIELPLVGQIPVVGVYFKKPEVDKYAILKAEWENLVKIDETKIAMQMAKEEEERARIEEEARQAQADKEERKARAVERRAKLANGAKTDAQDMEFNFGEGEEELETEGELRTNDIQRKAPLTQDEVNGVIRKNMAAVGRCVAEQKKYGSLSGTMDVRFTVSRRGTVVRATVMNKDFQGSYAADCISATMERMRFPRSGGSVTVTFPFVIR